MTREEISASGELLETVNLMLRPFVVNDAEAVFTYWKSDPGWEKYNASVPANFTLQDARNFVVEMAKRSRGDAPNWAVVYEGQVVGVVSIQFEQDHRIGVIGYGVHSDLRGRGLSVEAASTVIGYAFQRYPHLQKIRAHTDARNTASMRVLEKLGFSKEGTLKKNQYVKGQFCDEVIFGMQREQWCS